MTYKITAGSTPFPPQLLQSNPLRRGKGKLSFKLLWWLGSGFLYGWNSIRKSARKGFIAGHSEPGIPQFNPEMGKSHHSNYATECCCSCSSSL